MQPFFQGKIDTFCALYAVLNAFQIMYDITPGKGRELFNEVLVDQSRNEANFRAILSHHTDYVDVVDRMLAMVRVQFPFREAPHFAPDTPCEQVWNALEQYAAPELRRTAVFRFRRYAPPRDTPLADHWTTALNCEGGVLHFFDCSLETCGAYSFSLHSLANRPGSMAREHFVIAPESVRLLQRV